MTRQSDFRRGIYWKTNRKIRKIEDRRLAGDGVTSEDLTDASRDFPLWGFSLRGRKDDAMEQEKTMIEVVDARVKRHDVVLNEHEGRIRDLERNYSAEYQWRQATDKTLTAINTKLEKLLSEDKETYNKAKIAVITTFVSSIIGYIVGVLLR